MKAAAARAILFTAVLTASAGLLHWFGVGLPLLGAAAALIGLLALLAPLLGVRLLDRLTGLLRQVWWRKEQGKYYAFDGVAINVDDDGLYLWVDVDDWRKVRRTTEPEDVIAARHSARWRRNDRGAMQLRVDAVVDGLAKARDASQPRTVRLRRYLERELLFPAAERRRRRS